MKEPVKHSDMQNVKAHADNVVVWRDRLEVAKAHLVRVRGLSGQQGYSVEIGGRRLAVAVMDQRTYSAVLVRGMEMIHLGALKALAGEISDLETGLKKAQEALVIAAQPAPSAGEQA